MKACLRSLIAAVALLCCVAAPLFGQTPAPVTPPVTLWSFLGVPQGFQKIRDATANRDGYFPEKERKPPLKPIAAPENMDPNTLAGKVPAIAKAAEIKAQEDLAAQKIKAIKYLGEIGCGGCYEGVDEALLMALDDCTEAVRYEAVKAIYKNAGKKNCADKLRQAKIMGVCETTELACVAAKKAVHAACKLLCGKVDVKGHGIKEKLCKHCNDTGCEECESSGCACGNGENCCSKDITTKLSEIVYERNDQGKFKESSNRVREMAGEALKKCCPNRGYPEYEEVPPGDDELPAPSPGPERPPQKDPERAPDATPERAPSSEAQDESSPDAPPAPPKLENEDSSTWLVPPAMNTEARRHDLHSRVVTPAANPKKRQVVIIRGPAQDRLPASAVKQSLAAVVQSRTIVNQPPTVKKQPQSVKTVRKGDALQVSATPADSDYVRIRDDFFPESKAATSPVKKSIFLQRGLLDSPAATVKEHTKTPMTAETVRRPPPAQAKVIKPPAASPKVSVNDRPAKPKGLLDLYFAK